MSLPEQDLIITAVCVLDQIWQARNRFFFQGEVIDPSSLVKVLQSSEEMDRLLLKPTSMTSSTINEAPSKWKPACRGIIKANTDAYVLQQEAGIGVLFINHNGEALLVAAGKCDTNCYIQSIQQALDVAIVQGWAHLIIEWDCKIAVEALARVTPSPDWSCWSLFYHILGLCNFFMNVDFVWMERACNRSADFISINGSFSRTFQQLVCFFKMMLNFNE